MSIRKATFFLPFIIVVGIYFYFKSTLATIVLSVSSFSFILHLLIKRIKISRFVKKPTLVLLFLIYVILISNLYFKIYASYVPTNLSFVLFNLALVKNVFLGMFSSLAIYFLSSVIGKIFLKKDFTLVIPFGMALLSLLFLVIARLELLKTSSFIAIFILGLVVFLMQLKGGVYKKEIQFIKTPVYIGEDNKAVIAFVWIFFGVVIAHAVKGISEGPDGLRLYLNTTKFLGQMGRLPNSEIFLALPFPFELLASFAYLINGVSGAKFFNSSFFFLSLCILYRIAVVNKVQDKIIPLAIFASSPIIFYLISVEYKTELFMLVFILCSFYALKKNTPLVFFFAIFAVLTKYSATFIALPICVFALYKLFKEKESFKKIALAILFGFIAIIFWIMFWKPNLPFVGQVGFGGLPYKYQKGVLGQCFSEANSYEISTFYSDFSTKLGLIGLPFFKLFGGGRSSTSSLNDPGVFYYLLFLGLFYFVFLIFSKKENPSNFSESILDLAIVFISFAFWSTQRSDALWYNLGGLVLFWVVAWGIVSRSFSKERYQLLKKGFLAILSVLVLAYSISDPYLTYIPPGETPQSLFGGEDEKTRQRTYFEPYALSKVVNENNLKIIYANVAPFTRIDFFINNSQERLVFSDLLGEAMLDEQVFFDFIKKEGVGWAVYPNNLGLVEGECTKNILSKSKYLFSKYGSVIRSSGFADIYRLNSN